MTNDKNTDLHVHEISETLPEKPDEHAEEPGDRITLLIQENEVLRRIERDYHILLDTLQEGVWAIDQNGYTTFDALVTGASDKWTYVRLITPPAEGRVMQGQQSLRVGEKVRVRLLKTDPLNGYVDFACTGSA